MELAVSTVLADFRLTAWDVFEDWWSFRASNRAEGPFLRPQAFPTAGGISDRRRWRGETNFKPITPDYSWLYNGLRTFTLQLGINKTS